MVEENTLRDDVALRGSEEERENEESAEGRRWIGGGTGGVVEEVHRRRYPTRLWSTACRCTVQ